MSNEEITADRLATFSDAVFAVIVTIMVLELSAPMSRNFRPFCRSGRPPSAMR
jgi:uncharacterized membrane protein